MLNLGWHWHCGQHDSLCPVGHQAARQKLLALEGLEAWTVISLEGIARHDGSSSGRLPGLGRAPSPTSERRTDGYVPGLGWQPPGH